MPRTPFARRQIAASRHQSVLFMLCVVLSLMTLTSLSGFGRSVHASFLRDARVLHAGDVIVHSHAPLSRGLEQELDRLEQQGRIAAARVFEFYTVTRATRPDRSLLVAVKAVSPGYPWYGTVTLASGRPLSEVLTPGTAIVEQALLDRMQLTTGDRILIGTKRFVVRDIVTQEPDRPVNFFTLGPRVLIPAGDLADLGLLGLGSRATYKVLARTPAAEDPDRIAALLTAASEKDRERVETCRTAESGVKRFFDNLLFFLNLIGIFTLLLAGIGIQSALTAFLAEQERTIAIMKAIGAGSSTIIRSYLGVVMLLGSGGILLGIAASLALEAVLPPLFAGLLPAHIDPAVTRDAVIEGSLLGLVVVAVFTLLPLLRLREVRPRAIFGKEQLGGQARYGLLAAAVIVPLFAAMVIWRVRDVRTGVFFVLGVVGLVALSLLLAAGILFLLKRLPVRNLLLRQALRGLFRPRNATAGILTTLIASLTVLFSIALIERNLDATYVRSYPPDSPNLYLIDIQPDQKDALTRELGNGTVFHPLVRGTVVAVNGAPIDREAEHRKRGDNLSREFNLTFGETLLPDERIIAGSGLYRPAEPLPPVSIMDTVASMRNLSVGDRIAFRIQGVPLEARISSIRTRTRSSLQPFFYFMFPDAVLRDAPHTFFAALRVDRDRIAGLQNRVVSRFPNVTIIDVTGTVAVFAGIMERLSGIVRFFTLFSVGAGLLLIASSVFATRHARVQEAVFFTILGATRRFVLAVFAVETLLIGCAAAGGALLISQTVAWVACARSLDIAYAPFPGLSLLMAASALLAVLTVGLGATLPVLRKKPAAFLREQAEE